MEYPIVVYSTLSDEEIDVVYRQLTKKSKRSVFGLIAAMLVLIAVLAAVNPPPKEFFFYPVWAGVFGLVVMLIYCVWLLAFSKARKQNFCDNLKYVKHGADWEFYEGYYSIKIEQEGLWDHMSIGYHKLHAYGETDEFFYIYHTAGNVVILGKRFIPPGQYSLLQQVLAKNIKRITLE